MNSLTIPIDKIPEKVNFSGITITDLSELYLCVRSHHRVISRIPSNWMRIPLEGLNPDTVSKWAINGVIHGRYVVEGDTAYFEDNKDAIFFTFSKTSIK